MAKKENRTRLFVENFLVYGLGGIISKIVPIIMLPIITRIYPETYYLGLNDMVVTIVSFVGAVSICGMYDAMFRLFFEKNEEEYQKSICSTALSVVIVLTVIMFFLMLFFRKEIAVLFMDSAKYQNLVVLAAFSLLCTNLNNIVSAPTRIQNKRKVFLVTNTISPLIAYFFAIVLLIKGNYLIAMPLASILSGSCVCLIFWILNHKWFSIKRISFKQLKPLLFYGVSMLPNFFIYWVYNSSDKLMITQMLGTGYTGIYSVASKLGHASQLIYTAFSGGWLYFAYSTMKDDDQIRLKSKVFEYLALISYVATIVLMICVKPMFQILFTDKYLSGYFSSVYLFLAPLFLMLIQTIGNQFTINKKPYMTSIVLGIGAVVNVALNLCLIPKIGIEGASIATMSGYVISLVLLILLLYRYRLIDISKKFYIGSCIMILAFAGWRILSEHNLLLNAGFECCCAIILLVIYRNEVVLVYKKLKNAIKKRTVNENNNV